MDASNEKPKKREDLTINKFGDEVMLYDSTNEKIHVLNHTAYLIWKFCDGNHTINAIEREINKIFPAIELGDVSKDIKETIINFIKIKLII